MIRLQPKDMPDQEEENKKAHENVVENAVFFLLTIAVIRAGKYRSSKTWGVGRGSGREIFIPKRHV